MTVRGRVVVAVVALVGAALGPSGAVVAEPAPPDQTPQVVPFTGLSGPQDVAVDPGGTTYVADTNNDRIVKITASGIQSTLAFTGLAGPAGVAVDAPGNVYVADTGNDRILVLPADGGPQADLSFVGLTDPTDVVVDDLGTLYVADTGNDRVRKRTAAGAQSTVGFAGIGVDGPSAVAVDRSRNVYALDPTNNRVLRLAAAGGSQTVLGFGFIVSGRGLAVDGAGTAYLSDDFDNTVVGLPAGGQPSDAFPVNFLYLDHPSGLAVDDRGNVLVADTAKDRVIKVASGAGAPGDLGFTGLQAPTDVAVDSAGTVIVVDGNGNLVAKPAGGGPQEVWATGLNAPLGIAVDTAGDVFVADTNNNRIVRVAAGGGTPTVVPFAGLQSPAGVAVDGAGNVYVADEGNNRVVKRLASNGTQVTLPFTGLVGPWDVAVDADGSVIASTPGGGGIHELPGGGGPQRDIDTGVVTPFGLVIDRDGSLIVADGSDSVAQVPRTGGGWAPLAFTGLDKPFGLAIDAAGTVYAADSANDRVVKLVRTAPQLRVTTSPAVPAEISVDGRVRDSWGLNWADFGIGTHQVCFGPVLGYRAPSCQNANLAIGSTATLSGSYTPNGYLRAISSPAVATTITVDGLPRNDWGLWAEVLPGTYEVCFGAVAGYTAPACRSVVVSAGATATTTGTFTPDAAGPGPVGSTGFLRATTSPATASMISVDGQWRNNWGLDWVRVPVGSHQVCFGPAPAATAPPCQTVEVSQDAVTTVTGTYAAQGYLRVLTSPALPAAIRVDGRVANAYGMWTPKAPATYQVCFGAVLGYTTPACQSVAVTAGTTTTVTGTYAPA